MKMNTTPEVKDLWTNLTDIGKIFVPWISGSWICYHFINKVFRYFSDGRDEDLREIVKKEMQPKLDQLNEKLDAIQKQLWHLTEAKK